MLADSDDEHMDLGELIAVQQVHDKFNLAGEVVETDELKEWRAEHAARGKDSPDVTRTQDLTSQKFSKEQEEEIIAREKEKIRRELELKLRKEYEDKMAAEMASVVTEHRNPADVKKLKDMEQRLEEMESTNK